jgi:hypothetical protein
MTDGELFEHAKHLAYELEMAAAMPVHLNRLVDDGVIRNALLESFGVHVRNLAEFFARQRKGNGRMHASDFFSKNQIAWSGVWKANEEPWKILEQEVDDICTRVSQQIVHYTKHRIHAVGTKKDWAPGPVIGVINPWIRTFAEDADRLPSEMRTSILRISENVRRVKVAAHGVISTYSSHFVGYGNFEPPLI